MLATLKRLGICTAALTIALLGARLQAYPIVLLDDTWADGDRTETNLPGESATYVHLATGGAINVTTGNLAITQPGSSQRLWTYFTASGPVSLNVGETLIATIRFVPVGIYATTSRNFRFGVYRDPDPRSLTADGIGDNGPTGDPNTNIEGYGVMIPITSSPGTTTPFRLVKRDPTKNVSSLLGSDSAYNIPSPTSAGGVVVTWSSEVEYTLRMLISYVSPTQVDVTTELWQGSTLLSTHTCNDVDNGNGTSTYGFDSNSVISGKPPYTQFDLLYLRFSSNIGTADTLNFKQFRVEIIPEPASLALMALGSLLMVRGRKRS